ncbi:MAG TPA: ribosome silencing factor [Rubricoccaceae bacterium]|nr:ribosome silencing factor [Rubricoccaceae bacterium]
MPASSTPSARIAHSERARRAGPVPGRELAVLAVQAALDKKARDVAVMDLRGISGEVDYFVLCTGEADAQIKAIVDAVVERLREEAHERPLHREGAPGTSRWIVLDYFDLVVHVFDPALRAHYDLERLWGDAPIARIPEDTPAEAVAGLLPPEARASA